MSRSTVATKDAREFSKAWFQVLLLRVTDPRSYQFARPANALTDNSSELEKTARRPVMGMPGEGLKIPAAGLCTNVG